MSYPVVWRDQTYTLGDLTVGVKKAFVKWARKWLADQAIEALAHRPDVLASHLSNMLAEMWWADNGMSKSAYSVMTNPDGGRQLNRLLFGDSAKVLSDADLDALLGEKEADQASDYMVALTLIRGEADPKA